MEWVGHNTTCVVRFFSMGGDFDSMRRDARSRFRVRGSVVVGRSVDRWIVRVASSAHANRPRLKIARRDPEDGRSIGTDRTGSDRDARCGEGDAKVLAEMNGRTDERSNERRSSSRRDATRRGTGRFRRPSSVVRSVFRSESSIESPPIIGSRPDETEGANGFSPRASTFFLDEISCVILTSHNSSKVSPPILGISLGYGF
jgi:hypothetical protein